MGNACFSNNQICKICGSFQPPGDDYNGDGYGECRLNPPVITGPTPLGKFPLVKPEMWCRRWEGK